MSAPGALLGELARPQNPADRRRARLAIGAVAGSGVMLLAVIALLTLRALIPDGVLPDGTRVYRIAPEVRGLVGYLSEPGGSGGPALGAASAPALLIVAFVVFGLQALRTGTTARSRRLAALSLAGATRPQLRRLALLEGARIGVAGAAIAGPAYLLLWTLLGVLPPSGAKLLPTPSLWLLLSWPALIVGLGSAGAVAAALVATPGSVSPLGIVHRRPRPPGQVRVGATVLSAVLVILSMVLIWRYEFGAFSAVLVIGLTVVLAVSAGPLLISGIARLSLRRGLVGNLAGHRLLADVRAPGRVAAVLFVVGVAFGVIGAIGGEELNSAVTGEVSNSPAQVLGVIGTVTALALVAVVLACLSLAVGATEQVLDARRATAVLVALAASPGFVQRVVRRQLLLAAVPPALLGVLVGAFALSNLAAGRPPGPLRATQLGLPLAVVAAGLAAVLGALLAARAVGPAIRESSTPDNLRAP